MGVDTSSVLKRPVHCFGCDEAFYFTLRAIEQSKKLICPHCGTDIDLANEAYRPLLVDVRKTVEAISDRRYSSSEGRGFG
jgi:hypothetical protein